MPGVALDVQGSLDRIERALMLGQDEVELATVTLTPRRANVRFEDLDMSAVLGEMSTLFLPIRGMFLNL